MFDINIEFDDIKISSITRDDLSNIQKWINSQDCIYNLTHLDLNEMKEIFLQYYINECEFFLKIKKGSELIGIMKGRVEFKNPVEVWILYFIIDKNNRSVGLGTKILNNFVGSLREKYALHHFYTCIPEVEKSFIKFLNKNDFKLIRVSKCPYFACAKETNMYVMNLQNY